MRYLSLFIILVAVAAQAVAMDIVRVAPVAYDDQSGQWYVLLGHSRRNNVWNDFLGRKFPCEEPWVAAARILRCETCGFYNLNLATNPYCCRCNEATGNKEYVFFVPVDFQDILTIRLHATNGTKNDFNWVPAADILAMPDCESMKLCYHGKSADVTWGFTDLFQNMWPGMEKGYNNYPDHKLVHKYPDYPMIADAPISDCTNISWYRIPGSIAFFRKGTAYYEFTTVYPCSFRLDGKVWPSVEHYVQAMKFEGQPDVQEQIRQLPEAWQVLEACEGRHRGIDGKPRADWDLVKTDLMLRANRAKFSQNDRLRIKLVCTGGLVLSYDTRTSGLIDNYWGAGRNGAGRNVLGQVLMQIRYEHTHKTCGLSPFVEQPLASFTNGKYFAPPEVIAEAARG